MSEIKISDTSAGFEINIPSDRNWFLVFILAPFILCWVFVAVDWLSELQANSILAKLKTRIP